MGHGRRQRDPRTDPREHQRHRYLSVIGFLRGARFYGDARLRTTRGPRLMDADGDAPPSVPWGRPVPERPSEGGHQDRIAGVDGAEDPAGPAAGRHPGRSCAGCAANPGSRSLCRKTALDGCRIRKRSRRDRRRGRQPICSLSRPRWDPARTHRVLKAVSARGGRLGATGGDWKVAARRDTLACEI